MRLHTQDRGEAMNDNTIDRLYQLALIVLAGVSLWATLRGWPGVYAGLTLFFSLLALTDNE